jgi:hypothetical protein
MVILTAAVGNQQDVDHGEVERSCYGNRSSHWSSTVTGAVAGGPLSMMIFLLLLLTFESFIVGGSTRNYQTVLASTTAV